MLTQTLTTSFKAELLLAVHDFRTAATGGDTFKIALYSSMASLDANTTSYTTTDEITGTNYTAGGLTLASLGVTTANNSATSGTGFADFDDAVWPNATFTARGALIYNTTPSANSNANTTLTNASVCVLDFGSDKTATNQSFTVIFPGATSSTAIIRIGE